MGKGDFEGRLFSMGLEVVSLSRRVFRGREPRGLRLDAGG